VATTPLKQTKSELMKNNILSIHTFGQIAGCHEKYSYRNRAQKDYVMQNEHKEQVE
jgi:hypothetical protein